MTQVAHARADNFDDGSVTPLVIGMMICLLILGAGVTAAGSAFLAGQRLQHVCDGAAATAAGAITDQDATNESVTDAVNSYLAVRDSPIAATVDLRSTTLTLSCTSNTLITFGALFATPTLRRTVTATARTGYRQN
jgi:hypothetical protein